MPFATGYAAAEAALALTLCAHSYTDATPLPSELLADHTARMRRDIDSALAASGYQQWQIVWGPGLNAGGDNMLYVAGDAAANQYAVVIRGTDWQFPLDWLEDFGNLLGLDAFPSVVGQPAPTNVQVAKGLALGLQQLLAIAGSAGQQTLTLWNYLQQLPAGANLMVAGHSLGGGLASVLAAWLAWRFGDASRLKVYTFAAPSPGNADFAAYYNRLFRDPSGQTSTAYRIYNTLDLVPNAWASLPTIKTYYAPAPACTAEIGAVIDASLAIFGANYVQVGTAADGSAIACPGAVTAPGLTLAWPNPAGDAQFVAEVQFQHGTDTYLRLLQAAPVHPTLAKLPRLLTKLRQAAPGPPA